MYGPTEITVYALTHRVLSTDTIVPIGRPIANTSVYVLDPQLQLVPVGVPGELYIGGSGLARGYLNRPELTAKNFVKHKFSNGQETRLYKTGDLARLLPDGKIEYLGRLDHQIKLRGFRIEPGEIETVLSDFPGVQEAIVLATESVPGEPKLVAYIVQEPNQSVRIAELQRLLTAKLPDYMVPSGFVFLDKVPRTPNGKIDRRALPPPDPIRSASRDIFIAPRSSVEIRLASVWQQVLNIRPIGIRDNFFELGGDSLQALRFLIQTESIFSRKLPISALYKAPTVEQFARLLTEDVTTPLFHSLLVPLQTHGSKPPFVWVHGEVSDGLLPRYLGREQPLFGFRHQSHDDRKPALYATVRDIASHCIDELLTVRPHGPYSLGGYCFGGIIALEMARQLMERKHKVLLVALLDPDRLNNGKPSRVPVTSRKDGIKPKSPVLRRHLRNLRQLQFREQLEYIAVRSKQKIIGFFLVREISKMAKNVVSRFCLKFGYRLPSFVLSHYILGVYARALSDYVAPPYSGQVTIFKTADVFLDAQVWQNVAIRGAEVHEVPGSHTEVLKEPHIRVWAERLRIALDDAAAKSRKS
jgi:aspartate racemase